MAPRALNDRRSLARRNSLSRSVLSATLDRDDRLVAVQASRSVEVRRCARRDRRRRCVRSDRPRAGKADSDVRKHPLRLWLRSTAVA